MSAEYFLDLYRQIEELLEERYGHESGNNGNVVMRFMDDRQGKRYREELNLCREIRNVLSHHAKIGGQPVVEPAPAVVKNLEKLAEELKSPPKALTFATRGKNMLTAHPDDQVLDLMRQMQENGYSHLPVVVDDRVRGVFSVSTIFAFTMENPAADLTADTRVKNMGRYLTEEAHNERFMFAGQQLNYWEAKDEFNRVLKNKRLAAIFITDTGKKDGRLHGILTPWDVLGLDED